MSSEVLISALLHLIGLLLLLIQNLTWLRAGIRSIKSTPWLVSYVMFACIFTLFMTHFILSSKGLSCCKIKCNWCPSINQACQTVSITVAHDCNWYASNNDLSKNPHVRNGGNLWHSSQAIRDIWTRPKREIVLWRLKRQSYGWRPHTALYLWSCWSTWNRYSKAICSMCLISVIIIVTKTDDTAVVNDNHTKRLFWNTFLNCQYRDQ